MLVIVKERTKEIGIQRALGAKPIKVISQIISESLFLTSIAGFVGLSAGVWLVELINHLLVNGEGKMFRNPEVDIKVASIALIILVISGAIAGLLPASRAVSIKPIDAIRQEK